MSTQSLKEQALVLKARLQRIQEPKGYFFNKDEKMTLELLEALLQTKANYSYMTCPCRLASGDISKDKDIICPCEYREADVAEYGVCFCGLYASKAWNDGLIEKRVVPERRPADKIF